MPDPRIQAASSTQRLASLVDAYARRVVPAVLEQHPAASVSSALGVWLLLAVCAGAANGADRGALEEMLGCSAADAGSLLARFMAAPPPALRAAIAVWVRARDASEELAAWVRALPPRVQSGFMPTQAEADGWAQRETVGLIRSFPIEIDELTRIVLASALATRVSWEAPFGVVAAADHLGPSSLWRGRVARLLWDASPLAATMIARTQSAGLVAVHAALARGDLRVFSVSADPGVARAAVLTAAHEVASVGAGDPAALACSLYDLPLGAGHSWEITEQEVPTYVKEPLMERIAGAALPAWSVRGDLDLQRSPVFGTGPALQTLRRLIGPQRDDLCEATQTAVASFTRYGFEAAAVTATGIRTAAIRVPRDTVLQRSAVLRFDHPYAAVAIAGRPASPGVGASAPQDASFPGLPLFAVWVDEPQEPEDDPPGVQ
ncbi:MAG: hypothetical protein ACJ780_29595 [Solirubrobacteraceae bacterium]